MKPKRPLLWLMPVIAIAMCPHAGAAISWTTGTAGDASGDWIADSFNVQPYTAATDLDVNGTAAKTITTSGTIVTPLSLTVSSTGATTLTGTPVGGSLSKTNAGVLTLSTANTFGTVAISGGKFVLNDAAALGTTGTLNVNSGTVSGVTGSYGAPGATFFYDAATLSSSYTFSKAIAFGSVGSNTTYGMAMQQGSGTVPLTTTLSGNLTGASNVTVWLDVRATATPNFSTWILSGNNSAFAGNIRLNRGNIQFNSANSTGTGAVFLQTNGSDGFSPASGGVSPSNLTFGFSGTVANAFTLRAGSGSAFSVDTGANNVTLSGPLVVSGDVNSTAASILYKHGSGTLALAGTVDTLLRANGAVGATTPLTQGALTTGNVSANIVAGTLDISGMTGTNLTFNALNGGSATTINLGAKTLAASSGTFPGVFSGTGGIVAKNGSGTLTLSGANTYTGGTTISGGYLQFANSAAVPSTGAITINANGSLIASGVYTTVQSWLGDGRISAASTGAIAITGNSSEALNFTGFNSLGLSTTGSATFSGAITPGTGGYVFGGDAGTTLIVISALTGSNAVTKNGGSTVVLSSPINFSGPIAINGGTLALTGSSTITGGAITIGNGSLSTTSVNAIGTAGSTINLTNGLTGLIYTGPGETTDRVINYNSAANGGTITSNGSGPLIFTAPATTTATAAFGVIFNGINSGSFVGVTQPATPVLINFNKQGGGTWTLTGLNNLKAGAFRADGGVLNFASTSTTGSGADAATITRNNANAGVLTIANGASVITSTANTSGILGGWATFADNTWAVTNGNAAAITGLAAFTNDTWAAGTNTDVTLAGASPASASTTHSLRFNAAGAKTLTLAGVNLLTSGGILNTSAVGANTTLITGGTITPGALNASTDLIVHQNNTAGGLTIGSIIANNGTSTTTALTKVGPGLLTLNATNTYTGATTVNGGTVALNLGGAIGTIRGVVTVNSGGTLTGAAADSLGYTVSTPITHVTTLNLVGGTFNNAVNANQGYSTNVNLTGGTMTSTGGGAFNFNAGFGITSNAAGIVSTISSPVLIRNAANLPINVAPGTASGGIDLHISGVIRSETASGALTKNGGGTLRLSGANTFTGTTTVNGGTLLGAGSASSALTVNSGATLAPGFGIGTWSSTAATFTSGAILKAEINSSAATADKLVATGAVNLGGATLSLSDLGSATLASGTKFTLIDYTGTSLTGTFAGLPNASTVTLGANNFLIRYADASKVTLTAVVGTGYTAWASLYAGGQAANLDFDNDGVKNGVEYFMGTTTPGFTPNPSLDAGGVVTWPRDPSAAATYVVETSENLVIWDPATSGVTDFGTSVSFSVPVDGPKRFVRLRVTTP